jgi:uncharacterized protein (DUF433 family)
VSRDKIYEAIIEELDSGATLELIKELIPELTSEDLTSLRDFIEEY